MPTDNSTMNLAKKVDKDEFYTRVEDIEKECQAHISKFKNKIIYCNCDNPTTSNFFAYFALNFQKFGLKKLICTHFSFDVEEPDLFYSPSNIDFLSSAHKVVLDSPLPSELNTCEKILDFMTQDMKSSYPKYIEALNGDGDFRSAECESLLNDCDIVVSNPPFSLLGDYIPFVLSHKKDMLIIGNINALKYKGVFPYIKSGKLRFGKSSFNTGMYFYVPQNYEYADVYKFKREINGQNVLRVASICWYSTLEDSEPSPVNLTQKYDEKVYPRYSDYDAIEVNHASDIPCDYTGVMGVPITFINKLNYNQFEITDCFSPKLGDKSIYARLMIRRK